MPLIECPACNREISMQAKICPGCGHPIIPDEQDFTAIEPTVKPVLFKESFIHKESFSETITCAGKLVGTTIVPENGRQGLCPYCGKNLFCWIDRPVDCPSCGRSILCYNERFYKYFNPKIPEPNPTLTKAAQDKMGCLSFLCGGVSLFFAMIFSVTTGYSFIGLFFIFMGLCALIFGVSGKQMWGGLNEQSPALMAGGTVLVLLGYLLGSVFSQPGPTPQAPASSEATTDTSTRAYVDAKFAISDMLKAPATAEFQGYNPSLVKDLGSGKWSVTMYADAQNDFGAKLRKVFKCAVANGSASCVEIN